jgi:hypothetical protein
MRACSRCHTELPPERHDSMCLLCRREYSRRWWAQSAELARQRRAANAVDEAKRAKRISASESPAGRSAHADVSGHQQRERHDLSVDFGPLAQAMGACVREQTRARHGAVSAPCDSTRCGG